MSDKYRECFFVNRHMFFLYPNLGFLHHRSRVSSVALHGLRRMTQKSNSIIMGSKKVGWRKRFTL